MSVCLSFDSCVCLGCFASLSLVMCHILCVHRWAGLSFRFFVRRCVCLPVYLSACPSVCLSICLFMCLFVCLFQPISLSLCLSGCVSVYPFICLSHSLSIYLYVCLCVCQSIRYIYLSQSISLFVYLSTYLSVCLFVCVQACWFVCQCGVSRCCSVCIGRRWVCRGVCLLHG